MLDLINVFLFMLFLFAGIFGGFIFGYKYKNKLDETKIGSAEKEAKRIIDAAIKEGEVKKKDVVLQGRDEAIKFKTEIDKELSDRRREVTKQEGKLQEKEESIEKKIIKLEEKKGIISNKIFLADEKLKKIEEIKKKQLDLLEKISNFSKDQAKSLIIKKIEEDLLYEKAIRTRNLECQIKDESEKKAREVLSYVMQRMASEHVAETTVSVIVLPNDDMKGRIIGREGRNIRTIESLTGVDLIIDDTPETIAISAFDPIRREAARIAIEKLILDGRIHPANIESIIEKAKKEVDEIIKSEGEKAVIEAKIAFVHKDIINLLGKLYYRTSYGQNILRHSLEVSSLCRMIASEIGIDSYIAARAGLLHDIGKAVSHVQEGSHVDIGVEIAKKYKENEEIIHAIEAHHQDVETKTITACIVQTADAISAARPGARKENVEGYIKRLRKLEELALSFEGVEKCFAIQAGREIRIIVNPEKIKDDEMVLLAKNICKKVESNLTFPGQIKVNIIRESRTIDYAK